MESLSHTAAFLSVAEYLLIFNKRFFDYTEYPMTISCFAYLQKYNYNNSK